MRYGDRNLSGAAMVGFGSAECDPPSDPNVQIEEGEAEQLSAEPPYEECSRGSRTYLPRVADRHMVDQGEKPIRRAARGARAL